MITIGIWKLAWTIAMSILVGIDICMINMPADRVAKVWLMIAILLCTISIILTLAW